MFKSHGFRNVRWDFIICLTVSFYSFGILLVSLFYQTLCSTVESDSCRSIKFFWFFCKALTRFLVTNGFKIVTKMLLVQSEILSIQCSAAFVSLHKIRKPCYGSVDDLKCLKIQFLMFVTFVFWIFKLVSQQLLLSRHFIDNLSKCQMSFCTVS